MPRRKGMTGPGAGVMGGPGAKPSRPPTAMAGRAPAAPTAGALGPVPGGQPRMGGGGGGIGGASGFKKGGHAEKHEEGKREKFARGGGVENKGSEREAFAKGGFVGGDAKGRIGRDTGHAGKSS